MNLRQLRIIHETVRQNFNLTEVANELFTSQSGVSKHILDLESELGVEIFIRKGRRLIGLSLAGTEILAIAERMLLDSRNIKRLGKQYSDGDKGQLIIATTHTQALYALPKVVSQFKKRYPNVNLVIQQGSPKEIGQILQDGYADFGIASESLDSTPDLITIPYYDWYHSIVVPKGHPLEKIDKISLHDLADYPIVTYSEGITGRQTIDEAFAKAKVTPHIVMAALDADVIKTYVELELGVGIIASVAFQPERDTNLRFIKSEHLFNPNKTQIAIRKGYFLRGFAHDFIAMCTPQVDQELLQAALNSTVDMDLIT